MSGPVDWGLAAQAAHLVAGEGGFAGTLPGDVEATCAEAGERIAAWTGLVPASPLPSPEVVARPAWIDANLASMGAILDPVVDKLGDGMGPLRGPARSLGGLLVAAEAGALVGWLGRRVLGQYDVRLLEDDAPRRLLLVAPNLRAAAAHLDVDLGRLVQWVSVHEVTHAVQFGAVPWLREHLAGLLRTLLDGEMKVDLGELLKVRSRDDVRALVDTVRSGEMVRLIAGPERAGAIDQVQATMALVEGHAELVMDRVGEQILGDLKDLRSALDARRRDRPPVLAWIEKLMGLELKMRQYRQGRAFCDGVLERADVATLHRAFAAPELLPSLAELADPAAWLARIDATPAAA